MELSKVRCQLCRLWISGVLTALISPVAQSAMKLPLFDASDLTPYWQESDSQPEGKDRKVATLRALAVIDERGRAITQNDFKGKITLVNFFFTQCSTVCPLLMQSVARVHGKVLERKWKQPVHFFSFSIQPEHDSPEILKDYAARRHLNLKDWSLLTGKAEVIERIGRSIFKADASLQNGTRDTSFTHTSNVYLVDGKLRIRGIYDISQSRQMELLSEDMIRLEAD